MSDRAPLCSRCDALCCRLTVVLQDVDRIAPHLTSMLGGLHVMARDVDGWCVAVDASRMGCTIYDARPQACRNFAMAGPHCLAVRHDHARDAARGIPLALSA